MTKRKTLPKRLEKTIYQQFGSKCPFCGEMDVSTLQVHHIEPYAVIPEHSTENLLLTCANCHQKIEDGRISARKVHFAKFAAEQTTGLKSEAQGSAGGNTLTVSGDNHGVVANNISVLAPRASVRVAPMSGTISADFLRRNYAKYLIDRYHEFKQAEVGKGNVRYAILYKSIERQFGAKWDNLSIEKFDALVGYLQQKIDGTRLGKTRKARGQGRYSTFQDHMNK
ncbi:HNH endonuclease [Amaricoccus tamworthensis]|uniref:HNH endonuclease n=1 Tax=Amaricoccus tamworthensis TaxID=57002 RepID=UPI003C7DD9A8